MNPQTVLTELLKVGIGNKHLMCVFTSPMLSEKHPNKYIAEKVNILVHRLGYSLYKIRFIKDPEQVDNTIYVGNVFSSLLQIRDTVLSDDSRLATVKRIEALDNPIRPLMPLEACGIMFETCFN